MLGLFFDAMIGAIVGGEPGKRRSKRWKLPAGVMLLLLLIVAFFALWFG